MEAKDRFLIDCIWVDARDAVATSYLRALPGLCFHEEPPERGCASATGAGSPARGPRSIEKEMTATVLPVPERATANYRSALEKTRGVIMAGNLMIHEANCPKLVYALRQPLEDLLRSPVMKGLVWVITALEQRKERRGHRGFHSGPMVQQLAQRAPVIFPGILAEIRIRACSQIKR